MIFFNPRECIFQSLRRGASITKDSLILEVITNLRIVFKFSFHFSPIQLLLRKKNCDTEAIIQYCCGFLNIWLFNPGEG